PLITDPAKTGVDADLIENWGNKAVAGQQFWRVESRGDWDAVFYGGQKAWLFNPRLSPRAVPSAGMVVTPKAGKTSIPVYGTAYPDPAEWPAGIPVRVRNPLQYTIPAGQAYVVVDKVVSDAYYAPLVTLDPSDHLVVKGVSQFYQIYFGHRFAFVKADDVDVVYVR
ncbi:MAG: N-acetylmuramoyl-L-alanine amidase, partial [Anaerolineae bacterium]|nr:N-acetylmuramoyl-L-alanine amidase [Anaerolineae bacterium]